MRKLMTYCEAINAALKQEMRLDERVFIYGVEDKVFGSLDGLVQEFGQHRCFATPISEESGLGVGLGAALNGLRPIQTHIRVDFLLLAMNQLINMISTCHYGSAGKISVPLVIRAVIGRGWGQGYQHSKSLHGMFAQIPGLKVLMPTTPSDAKGMLASAIRDDNPVLVLEHRWLYWQSGEVETEPYTVEIGQPEIRRYGTDITIVATSWMTVEAVQAADILRRCGVEAEVIDVRTITPLDDSVIVESVKKTGLCVIADNDWVNCGFSGEISSRIYERCWGHLSAPISRIGFAHVPCPTTRPLESAFYPNASTIVREIEKVMGLQNCNLSNDNFYSHENRFLGPF